MLLLHVRIRATEGKRDELIAAVRRVAAETRREEGCLAYGFYEDTEERGSFLFVEAYRDREALDAHRNAPYFHAYRAETAPMVASRETTLYEVGAPVDL